VPLKFWRISLARSVKFEVFGQEYSLNTEAPEEDVQEILEMVRIHLHETCKSSSVVLSSKSAILASLNMAGKYVKLKRDFADYRSEVETLSSQIRKKIEDFVQLS
jgi:cell division protein ZapA